LNILLVDDDYILARSTAKLLHRLGGHHVYITDDPAEIFHLCQTQVVDLVIMDINLPTARWQGRAVSGVDLSRVLKNQEQTAQIPIIIVTAYVLAGDRQFLLATSQADEFVAKPITDYSSLLELIRCLCHIN
jgi:CheY-like chemotaxis protein